MLRLLFNEGPLPFSIHDPDIAWLYANGVIDKEKREHGHTGSTLSKRFDHRVPPVDKWRNSTLYQLT